MTDTPAWYEYGLNFPSETHETRVAGARIVFETWGEPGLPGIVLIHGSNAHRHWWRFVAPYLADQFRVAAIDLSGNGDSDWRPRYQADELAAEVFGVCEAAKLGDKPFVVGHSFGGFVALKTAANYGAELSGVIFNDFTTAPPERSTEWGMRVERDGLEPGRATRIYPDMATALARFRFIPEEPDRVPAATQYIGRQGLREVEGGVTWKFDPGLFDYLEMGTNQRDQFATLKCPSAVITGEFSTDEGALDGDYMRELCANLLPVFKIPGTYHHMMFEEPLALAMAFKAIILGWRAEAGRTQIQQALAGVVDADN